MMVWKVESQVQLDRSKLLQISSEKKSPGPAVNSAQPQSRQSKLRYQKHYCRACNRNFSSYEGLMNHCFTVQHKQQIFKDVTVNRKFREPPPTCRSFTLCKRPITCENGERCIAAHSREELKEWQTIAKAIQKKARAAQDLGLLSYQDQLLEEYKNTVPGVRSSCDTDLITSMQKENVLLSWTFSIQSDKPLTEIALLKQEPGASFFIGENTEEQLSYSTGDWYCRSDETTYEVKVSFIASCPGFYEQWLVFDFDTRPVLLHKLKVKVGEQSPLIPEMTCKQNEEPSAQVDLWNRGSRDIILYFERTIEEGKLLNTFKPPKYFPTDDDSVLLQNYNEKMHNFLYQEEMTQEQILCSTVSCTHVLKNTREMKWAPPGELFGALSSPYTLTPDSPEGFILKLQVNSVLVGKISANGEHKKVYEARLLKDTANQDEIHLQFSKTCVSDLNLQHNQACDMGVQFQLDRLFFCKMHQAIDLLPNLERVLPDFESSCAPVHTKKYPVLNVKQQAAIDFILGDADGKKSVAPLLIYGPFGTGKTFTIAKAAMELVKKKSNKVLICTHTNSSADLYVKDHFHEHICSGELQTRPLRIKAEEVDIWKTHKITLQYCNISTKTQNSFVFPDRHTVDSARIIITTTAMAQRFHDLNLPLGYFTHIMIDEASQMLETEALMALGLTSHDTRVVLAGDHMQMGPKLFSVREENRSDYTLLNRLFHLYQADDTSVSSQSRIIFNENYRSTQEIVNFASTYFYVGKNDAIKACGNVPAHPDHYPLSFCHVRGECCLDTTTRTWYNIEEVRGIGDIVQGLLSNWPDEWDECDLRTICVLSEGAQVFHIRNMLKHYNLGDVTVENAQNVQGKQFRVIILSTVHTVHSIEPSGSVCLEFFNDSRVLNTVITRAQSQVIVVGDAPALCYFGKCSRIWKCYIEHCINNRSAKPEHLTDSFLKEQMMVISRFVKSEDEDISDTDSSASETPDIDDPILQELLDESKGLVVNVTEEGLIGILPKEHTQSSGEYEDDQDDTQNSLMDDVCVYRNCEIMAERYNLAYATPLNEPTLRIVISGSSNMHCCLPGDLVDVQLLNSKCNPPNGKVLRLVKPSQSPRVYVCTVDNYDNQVMTPINIAITKIYAPFWKDKPNYIAVRPHEDLKPDHFVKINEETKRNNLFVVKVLRWHENFRFPLGVVVKVLPKVTSLVQGLEVLDIEYNLSRTPLPLDQETLCKLRNTSAAMKGRQDFRNIITFTIDPSHSQDLDDAISVRDLGQKYEIGVHIADVASFIDKGSALDNYAKEQGTAYYTPGRKPHYMLPKELSEDFLSLLPDLDRHAISLMVIIDKKTDCIESQRFYPSVICSNRKFSYEDVEEILLHSTTDNGQSYDTLEGCLTVACHFSEVQRKRRKQQDWCYKMPDDDVIIGSRRSHRLVEELMIMFNHTVADLLLSREKSKHCTPVRCQAGPHMKEIHNLRKQCTSWLPMSIHLSHNYSALSEGFSILTPLHKNLQRAAEDENIHAVLDMITTDDIYPQLLPLVIAFKSLLKKAYVLRSNSTALSRVGHYDLRLDCYTWASSPIRRYLDLIVQRILHSIFGNKAVTYTALEMDRACLQFSQQNRKQSIHERTACRLSLASQLNVRSAQKTAFITRVFPNSSSFGVSFPFLRNSTEENLPIMYRDLQLADQPQYDETKKCVVLKWVRRVYSFTQKELHTELQQVVPSPLMTTVSAEAWTHLMSAIREEKWENVLQTLKTIGTQGKKRELQGVHFHELSMSLRPGDAIQVQLGTDTARGLLVPKVQLLVVHPKFEICLEHAKKPIECFSSYALRSSRDGYTSYDEYQKIWQPLCEMESTTSAVAENDSIVLEDVELTWSNSKKDKKHLKGFFYLPLEKKTQWSIECDFQNCFLCIRLRGIASETQPEDLSAIPNAIWIAHGITTAVSDREESKEKGFIQIDFRINHLPSSDTPRNVFLRDTRFTVELIPKLLPDVRKEDAVRLLTKANHLVKEIALGKKIHSELNGTLSHGFPPLNSSQQRAIRESLQNQFTLIQGPPGTGKTVVGVYIVYHFFKSNKRHEVNLKVKKTKDNELVKKRSILYCGPSNKSVDVVAGQLLKLSDMLRPLRVYSEQMEMMEYPYPGSKLKLSRHSCKYLRTCNQLENHTHLNNSSAICAFDNRIKAGEALTDDEIKMYKSLLQKAKVHELKTHDVILSTCTAAANPNFTKALKFQQIIIDECAMATEPEAFIPLVMHQPEQIVLIGDHKQLRPIVNCDLVQKLGMRKSLFERYMKKALMLDTQYRMHKDICKFPSETFYNGNLKTGCQTKPSVLMTATKSLTHIVFGNVEGKETSLVVSTERGNENSKANYEEAQETVRIASQLIWRAGVKEEQIAILTPYNAQVAKINEILSMRGIQNVKVTTITKSQGSEWRYVILSTVRSWPKADIDQKPTKSWLTNKLGFVMDPNQVNVGITRAQEGLCIIGNEALLRCSFLWRNLINQYQKQGCVVDPASGIRVHRPQY
uniref:C3H1-type domain-containing protein n=1 Tax=Denticeps clupeoides TaxID=299321 RepID=A0AAY4EVB2_9TELE